MDDNSMQESLLSSAAEHKGDLKARVLEESKKIWRVAMPSLISRVSSFGTIVVTQSFIGHINSLDLAGYALVQTLSVRFVNGILIGMSSATETLCGQAFGARQYHMMGIYLQRSWFIDLITLTLLLPVFLFATPIFNLLGEEEAIAKSAGYISLWFIPFVYGLIFSLTIQMYLQAQQKNMIIAWLSAVQFVIHILLSYLFVDVLDFGVAGAMGALCISSWFVVLGIHVHLWGVVPGYMERVQCSCRAGPVAGRETIDIVWRDDLGIWLGMNTGVVAQTLSLAYMVWRTNWDEEVSKTSTRLKKWYLRSSEGNNHACAEKNEVQEVYTLT
ncbi:UNVERIFIED_CONTAM: protein DETOXIFICATION 24 [Sesamum latifolium]|uniref:Protein DETOXIFICATION 24 n=1 Tax=Sesamum latifolium TaxID=2727402 RepID=A0AAW2XKE2_9LAMI